MGAISGRGQGRKRDPDANAADIGGEEEGQGEEKEKDYDDDEEGSSFFSNRQKPENRKGKEKAKTAGKKGKEKDEKQTVGRYPYEDPATVRGIRLLAAELSEKEDIFEENFPPVASCSRCPDFSVCIAVKEKQRCFRRTLEREPCPELCTAEKNRSFQKDKQKALKVKAKKIGEMVDSGAVKTVGDCKDCRSDSICIPQKKKKAEEEEEKRCIKARLLSAFPDPCMHFCEADKEGERCRILGNECVRTKRGKKVTISS